jgi:hypothetical protein
VVAVLMGKRERNRPLGRPRRRWKHNIKIYLKGLDWGGLDWIDLGRDRDRWRAFVNAVMSFRVSQNARNLFTSWRTH